MQVMVFMAGFPASALLDSTKLRAALSRRFSTPQGTAAARGRVTIRAAPKRRRQRASGPKDHDGRMEQDSVAATGPRRLRAGHKSRPTNGRERTEQAQAGSTRASTAGWRTHFPVPTRLPSPSRRPAPTINASPRQENAVLRDPPARQLRMSLIQCAFWRPYGGESLTADSKITEYFLRRMSPGTG